MPIEAHFEYVLVLTYAFSQDLLQPLLPRGLTLDCYGEHGFVAVACVQTKGMRPKGWPELVGQNFFLVGYRIFTRFRTAAGQNLRGLRILRSDADRALMVFGGNLLTHYHYHRARVTAVESDGELNVEIESPDGLGDLKIRALVDFEPVSKSASGMECLPDGSLFKSVREALKFAGPLPFTFDYESETDSIIRIEGVRQKWHPQAVAAEVQQLSFFGQEPFCQSEPIFCSAFYLEDVPYYWKAGICEKLPNEAQEVALPRGSS